MMLLDLYRVKKLHMTEAAARGQGYHMFPPVRLIVVELKFAVC